jgi:hypothetical protein
MRHWVQQEDKYQRQATFIKSYKLQMSKNSIRICELILLVSTNLIV